MEKLRDSSFLSSGTPMYSVVPTVNNPVSYTSKLLKEQILNVLIPEKKW